MSTELVVTSGGINWTPVDDWLALYNKGKAGPLKVNKRGGRSGKLDGKAMASV